MGNKKSQNMVITYTCMVIEALQKNLKNDIKPGKSG